ncbi:MAG: FtsW/RodA/SpoVE family cell cycle protein [Clostridiales bacterium]|nr:FtsW/RodA/SpoVE family cell cycle protein [Clostridiales bacterium]
MAQVKHNNSDIGDIEKLIDPATGEAAIPESAVIHTDYNLKALNIPMLLMLIVMIVFGLVILYSVSGPDAYGLFHDSAYFLKRQIIQTLLGLAACIAIAFWPIGFFAKKPIMIGAFLVSLGLAIWTLAAGVGSEHGATRWVNIGSIQFQSSEVIKVALIIAFAGYRAMVDKMRKEGKIHTSKNPKMRTVIFAFVDLIVPAVFVIIVDGVIILQPHVSCFIIIAIVIVLSAFASEIPFKSWLVGGGLIIAAAIVLGGIALAVMPTETREKLNKNYAHVFKRLAIFNMGDEDDETESNLTKDDTRQIDNAHNALGSGGMWGVGLGNSRSKYNYVAEAQNDYIFSIYVEETGFVGGLILMTMYMIMFIMCVRVILQANGVFNRTVATGCTALIFVEVLLNIAVELKVIPATGVTLPFMSYGGTAQIMLLVAYGFILSVSKYGKKPQESKPRRLAKKAV